MPWSPSPFPWWLWLLVGVWASAWVLWQRVGLTPGWRRVVWGVGVLYTVMILSVSTRDVIKWSPSLVLLWCTGSSAVAGSLLLLASPRRGARRWGTWLVSCGTAGMLVLLGAAFAGALALLCGSWLALGRATEKESPEDVANGPVLQIARSDGWLLVVALTLGLTGWLGTIRQAVRQEMPHVDSIPWITVQPGDSLSVLKSKRERASNRNVGDDALDPHVPEAEALGLGAILFWTYYRLRTRVRAP